MSNSWREANRQQWWALGVWVLISTLALGYMIVRIEHVANEADRQITAIEANRGGVAEQTLRGCQRGNELRRAIRLFDAEFSRECPLCRAAVIDIDPDAATIDDCRETTERISGVDPGPVSDFVEGP